MTRFRQICDNELAIVVLPVPLGVQTTPEPGNWDNKQMKWLLNWRERVVRGYIRDTFRRYISEDAIQGLENGSLTIQPAARKIINFAIFEIKDEDAEDVQASLRTLVPLLIKNRGMVMGFSTVLLAMFEDEPNIWFGELSLALQSPDLRTKGLYGQAECWVGNWGGPMRMSYGPLIPGFGRLLARLDSQNYGTFEQA